MFPRSRFRFAAFWMVAAALLLKAAVPLLAVAAARAQGHALVEICTVYGVKTIAVDAQGQPAEADPAHGSEAAHAGSHCALTGLLAVAGTAPATDGQMPDLGRVDLHPPAHAPPTRPDRSAHWFARLTHAPPSHA